MTPLQVLTIVLALSAASFVQGIIGFAAGMIAIPVMVWGGIALPMAIAALLPGVAMQTLYGTWSLRKDWVWRDLIWINCYRFLSLPVGLGALAWVTQAGVQTVKQYLGALMLVVVGIMVLGKVQPRERLAHGWTAVAGSAGGFLAGAVGMGGPPVVLWAQAHDWSTRRTRTFLWSCFMALIPLQMALLWVAFGSAIWVFVLVGALATPLILVAARYGSDLGDRLSRERMRTAAYAVMALIAVGLIVESWL